MVGVGGTMSHASSSFIGVLVLRFLHCVLSAICIYVGGMRPQRLNYTLIA